MSEEPTGRAASEAVEDIQELLRRGPPEHPVPDFDDAIVELTDLALEARRRRAAHESEVLEGAVALVERIESQVELVEDQVRQLETVRSEFRRLGAFGEDGLARAEALLGRLSGHRDRLRSLLADPSLREAQRHRQERRDRKKATIAGRLSVTAAVADVQGAVTDLLDVAGPEDGEWAFRLVEDFERDGREAGALEHLEAVRRFWRTIRTRLPAGAMADRAREKARRLKEEIGEREATAAAAVEVERLIEEVRNGTEYLEQAGPEERVTLIHIWLGRLRKYQDEYDFDEQLEREVYFTFGRINRVRKDLAIDHFFDALSRGFTTDWDAYVETWQARMETARANDRLEREARRKRQLERAEREREERKRKEEADRRLAAVVADLEELGKEGAASVTPVMIEELRALLHAGVEAGGCRADAFLRVAAQFAPHTYGADFRGLRRSLKKSGVPDDRLGTEKPPQDDRFEEVFAELRPRLEGKRILVAGGMPNADVQARIARGLELGELRWYEHYRSDNHQDAETAIQSGGFDAVLLLVRYSGHKINELRDAAKARGLPVTMVDRGCGVTAILRGLESLPASPQAAGGNGDREHAGPTGG